MPQITKERQPEHRWSPEEDKILLSAIEEHGPTLAWSEVSSRLPGRNSKSCRKRWIHSLDPTLRKGRWTGEEDALLVSAVENYGHHWFQVAKVLPGRTDDQCAKRWRENLDPSISREPWTKEDDELLMKTYEDIGKRWKDLASRFEGRPPVHCRNRVQSLLRARRRSAAAARKAAQANLREKSLAQNEIKAEPSSDALTGLPNFSSFHLITIPIQEIDDRFPIASTSTGQQDHPFVTACLSTPQQDNFSPSPPASPLSWGTPPHPQYIQPRSQSEDSLGITPPQSLYLVEHSPTLPEWVTPWSYLQSDQSPSSCFSKSRAGSPDFSLSDPFHTCSDPFWSEPNGFIYSDQSFYPSPVSDSVSIDHFAYHPTCSPIDSAPILSITA